MVDVVKFGTATICHIYQIVSYKFQSSADYETLVACKLSGDQSISDD